MCSISSASVAICTVLLCCDLTRASRLSTGYISEKSSPDIDSQDLPIIYRILHQHPSSLHENEDDNNFEGLLNFKITGSSNFIKRVNPPYRNWCRLIGLKNCSAGSGGS